MTELCLLWRGSPVAKMASAMDVDDEESELPSSSSGKGEKKRFEVKKVYRFMLELSPVPIPNLDLLFGRPRSTKSPAQYSCLDALL